MHGLGITRRCLPMVRRGQESLGPLLVTVQTEVSVESAFLLFYTQGRIFIFFHRMGRRILGGVQRPCMYTLFWTYHLRRKLTANVFLQVMGFFAKK